VDQSPDREDGHPDIGGDVKAGGDWGDGESLVRSHWL
jgi:hypothetical protein